MDKNVDRRARRALSRWASEKVSAPFALALDQLTYDDLRLLHAEIVRYVIAANKAKVKSRPPLGVPKKLWDRALDIFEDDEKIRAWFSEPNRALGGRSPIQVIKDEGPVEIGNILGRIEHGVFS